MGIIVGWKYNRKLFESYVRTIVFILEKTPIDLKQHICTSPLTLGPFPPWMEGREDVSIRPVLPPFMGAGCPKDTGSPQVLCTCGVDWRGPSAYRTEILSFLIKPDTVLRKGFHCSYLRRQKCQGRQDDWGKGLFGDSRCLVRVVITIARHSQTYGSQWNIG